MANQKFVTSFEELAAMTGIGSYVTLNGAFWYINGDGSHFWIEPTQERHVKISPRTGSQCLGGITPAGNSRLELILFDDEATRLGLNTQQYSSFWIYFSPGFLIPGSNPWLIIYQASGSRSVNWHPTVGIRLEDNHQDGVSPLTLNFFTIQNNAAPTWHYGAKTDFNPRGRWVHIEFFNTWSPTAARVWCKIDGALMWDHNGSFHCIEHNAEEPIATLDPNDPRMTICPCNIYGEATDQRLYWDDLELWDGIPGEVLPPPVTYLCPYGDATFNTQAELDTHIVTHWQPADSSNLARIPEDWGLEYSAPPTIIFIDHYVYHTPGRPSIRLDPHTAADVNTAREVNPLIYHRVKAGDHIIFKCWMKTDPSTLEPPDPNNPVSLYAGARIGIDFYGDDPASGKNGAITGISSPTLPQTDEGVLQNYVHWGSDWQQRTIEFDVPATAISELNGLAYPVTALGCWLQCWSSTYGANDPALAWFADAELTIIPSVPPPTIKYVCPFDNQEFLVAAEAITHLNTVHYPSPTLEKWVIEFKPWPIP